MVRGRIRIFLIPAVLALGTFGGLLWAQRGGPLPPDQIAGKWTIYAENADKPGSSLKYAQFTQNGSIVAGHFKGPNQSGKLQGWVNAHHVEFSTDTCEVITFRGQIQ